MSTSQYFPVYKVRLRLAVQDPDMPAPRFHTLIFVQTDTRARAGVKHHVTGDITSGMYYEAKPDHNPESSEDFHSQEIVGYVAASRYPHEFDDLLRGITAPPKQKAFNVKTRKTEPVKSWTPLIFYASGEERPPLVKCTEWTERQAIPALCRAGLIEQERSE